MHKLNLNKDKKNKLELSEIELLTLLGMGFFGDIKKMKKRVDSKPSSNSPRTIKQKPNVKKEKFVDLHLEIVKKVDELIEGNDKEIKTEKIESETRIRKNPLIINTFEVNESFIKGHESHTFQNELEFPKALGDLAQRQEFYEVEAPTPLTPDIIKIKEGDFTSWMAGNADIKNEKTTQSIGKINFIRKTEKPKNKGVTKTKNELEKTKAQIETKKKELEEAIQKEKEKELELKQKEVEKRKREKLKKLNLKKKMKEEKQKEKERELELKRKKEEKQRREKLRQQELKKKMKEEKLKEKKVDKKVKTKEVKKQEKPKEKKVIKPVKKEKQEKPKDKKVKKPEKKEKQEKPKEINIIDKEEEKEPETLDNFIKDERPEEKEPEISEWDEDVERLLPIIDKLFEKLPEDVVDEFVQSEDFSLYEKVVLKYKNK